jgi:hypothetical protein
MGYRFVIPWFFSMLSERMAGWLAGATLLALVVIFAIVYPIANSGVVGGGTDRDEALNIAVQELLNGRYPYYPKTYLQAPISPLPGSVLLAMPFVVLGNSAYQNIFWIAVFYLLVARYFADQRVALLLSWTALALSPLFWQEFVTGGDLLANSLFVCVFTILMGRIQLQPDANTQQKIAIALLLGVGLASRPNYLLLLLPIGSLLWQARGWRVAAAYTALTLLIAAIITLPFYFYDPAGFSPLHTFRKVDQFSTLLPFAGMLILLLSGLTAVLLALRPLLARPAAFFRACALPQAVPIVAGLIFYAIARRLDYTFPGYGFSFMWFGLLAAGLQVKQTSVLYSHPDALKSSSATLR